MLSKVLATIHAAMFSLVMLNQLLTYAQIDIDNLPAFCQSMFSILYNPQTTNCRQKIILYIFTPLLTQTVRSNEIMWRSLSLHLYHHFPFIFCWSIKFLRMNLLIWWWCDVCISGKLWCWGSGNLLAKRIIK